VNPDTHRRASLFSTWALAIEPILCSTVLAAAPAIPDPGLSLTALAEWVRQLPVTSLAPMGILLVAGLLLLSFGQRLLKPVLVLASIFLGVLLFARIGQRIDASIPPIAWSAGGAVIGLVAAILSYRFLLGLAMGVIGATVAILLALTAVQLEWIDVYSAPPPVRADAKAEAELYAMPAVALTSFQSADAGGEASTSAAEGVASSNGPLNSWIQQLNAFVDSLGPWFDARWQAMPKPMRTLVTASATMGGFLGFVAGASCPTWAAATLTSLFGSLLVLLCGAPILSRFLSPESIPEVRPLGWLCIWLGVAFVGATFQWMTRPKPPPSKRQADADPAGG
jgi:hypothetical protein